MEVDLNSLDRNSRAAVRGRRIASIVLGLWILGASYAHSVIQFDVFLGYDGAAPSTAWFPVVFELKNDEASFAGMIVLSPGSFGRGPLRRIAVELPTGTLKRVVLPVFAGSGGMQSWDARLYDSRGKVRAEALDLQPRRQPASSVPILGTISRSISSAPVLKAVTGSSPQLQPIAAELQVPIFADTPLALEGLDALYLNSERAFELRPAQAQAILNWIDAGGHLIVAIEQAADLVNVPWFKQLACPLVRDAQMVERHPEFQSFIAGNTWNTNFISPSTVNPTPGRKRFDPDAGVFWNPFDDLPADVAFEASPVRILTGEMEQNRTLLSIQRKPAIVTSARGRGKLTWLLVNPEREPLRSWKHLPIFWALLADVPLQLYSEKMPGNPGGWSSDAVYGGLVETRQVRKLPIGWLLALLLVYLAVIGPVDRYLLRRLGRPTLTWVTFPCYVALFSALIYFIGFKLRAGESEFGELNIVDVLAGQGGAPLLRGRTYGSIYSPTNRKYPLASEQALAALRDEFSGSWGGQAAELAGMVTQVGEGFSAEVPVPVWSSRLFVSDWYDRGNGATKTRLHWETNGWTGEIENVTPRELGRVMLAVGEAIFEIGPLAPGEKKTLNFSSASGTQIGDFTAGFMGDFNLAATYRRRVFGQRELRFANTPGPSAIAAAFLQHPGVRNRSQTFQQPPGLELSSFLLQGGAVVFAWEPDHAPFPPMLRMTPRRIERHTLWRELISPAIAPAPNAASSAP